MSFIETFVQKLSQKKAKPRGTMRKILHQVIKKQKLKQQALTIGLHSVKRVMISGASLGTFMTLPTEIPWLG